MDFQQGENRYEFENDLKKFYSYLFDNITKFIIYKYIDIYKLKYSKLKELYRIFISKERKNIYISNDMMYAVRDGIILGVSFPMLEYCGISREKVLKKIKENRSDGIIYDNSKDVIKLGRFLGNKKYAIPYFI